MRNILLLIAFIYVQTAYSQDAYFKSSIITLQNDTIKGFISNVYDSKTFKFKKKLSDKPVLYTPNLLRGVILDGNVFETKAVNLPYYKSESITMATTSAQCLEKDTQRGRLIDTIFAQKLIKGTASLFRYKDKSGFIYYLLEKNNVLKDLPPRNCYTRIDSGGMRTVQDKLRSNVNTSTNFTVYTYIKDDYLDTLGIMLNDKRYITNPTSMYSYTEKNLSYYVRQYNKDIGEPNGGMLKNKISRKIFTGISLGPVNMIYDEDIAKADLAGSYAIKLYGLYPLLGVNKSLYAKFGFNYMTYRNDIYKKSIASASFGLRQVLDKTYIRPYFEGAISLASLNKNNRPIDIGFPLLLEAGVIVPIKNLFLTLSASHTPVVVYKLIGYKLWSFNVGVMF